MFFPLKNDESYITEKAPLTTKRFLKVPIRFKCSKTVHQTTKVLRMGTLLFFCDNTPILLQTKIEN
jgi:hypothetical protein